MTTLVRIEIKVYMQDTDNDWLNYSSPYGEAQANCYLPDVVAAATNWDNVIKDLIQEAELDLIGEETADKQGGEDGE